MNDVELDRGLFSRAFEELNVGDAFETPGRTLREADLVGFATLTHDYHPIHLDEEWARESMFGRRIAHGMLVLSYATGLLPLDPDNVLALRRVTEVTFKRPASIGDTIRVRARVEKLSQEDYYGVVRLRFGVHNQDRAKLATGALDALWRRESVDCRVDL